MSLPDGVHNAAEPDWACDHCGTRHGADLDAAARCAAAGPVPDRGPLAVFDDTLRVLHPSGAAKFTHEVLYGPYRESDLHVDYPAINLTRARTYQDPGDAVYGVAIDAVPLANPPELHPRASFSERRRTPRVRPLERGGAREHGWFGPIGNRGVDVLTAARSALLNERGFTTAAEPGRSHDRSSYPYFDSNRWSSYSPRWPHAYGLVAETVCGTTNDAVLVRWLHHHHLAVDAWLAAQFRTWVTGGDATVPAFHTFTGAYTEKAPGIRRAAVLAPVADPERHWDRDALDTVKSDDRLGARAQEALLNSVRTDTAPTIDLPTIDLHADKD
jgi:hypothetical protein